MRSYAVGETGVKQVDRGATQQGEGSGEERPGCEPSPKTQVGSGHVGGGAVTGAEERGEGHPVGPLDEHGKVCGGGALDGHRLASRLSPCTSSATPDVVKKEEGGGPRKPLYTGSPSWGRRRGTAVGGEPPAPELSRLLPAFPVWGWMWARGQGCPRMPQFPSNTFPTRRMFQSPIPRLRGSGAGEVLSTVCAGLVEGEAVGTQGGAGSWHHCRPLGCRPQDASTLVWPAHLQPGASWP